MTALTIEAYLAGKNCFPTRETDKDAWYHCPLVVDRTPSFKVDRQAQVWYCHSGSCKCGGDLRHLIARMEAVPTWVVDLTYGTTAFSLHHASEGKTPLVRSGKQFATALQQEVMTAAMQWWHAHLMEKSEQAKAARHYLLSRGVTLTTMDAVQIGYAPPDDRSGRLARDLFDWIKVMVDGQEGWGVAALECGIFQRENPERMANYGRIMFCCTNTAEQVLYYQGRVLPPREAKAKYLGPALVKYPFWLPPQPGQEQIHPGTIVVESPMGPAVADGLGLFSAATLGNGLDIITLSRFPTPFWMAQDNDEPRPRLRNGIVVEYVQPGEKQAQDALALCREYHLEAYRLEPGRMYKGLDEQLADRGVAEVQELRERMREHLSHGAAHTEGPPCIGGSYDIH